MPIIRQTSFGEQAGAAAQAFGQATQGQNDQLVRVHALKQRQAEAELRRSQETADRIDRQREWDRRNALAEARLAQNETQFQQNQARLSGVGPSAWSGDGILKLGARAHELGLGDEADAILDAATGGAFLEEPPTAEALEGNPSAPQIAGRLGRLVAQGEKQRMSSGIESAVLPRMEQLHSLDPEFMQSPEGMEFLAAFNETLTESQRLMADEKAMASGVDPVQAAKAQSDALYAQAVERITVRRDREDYWTRSQEVVEKAKERLAGGFAMEGEDDPLTKIRQRQADLRDPRKQTTAELEEAWLDFMAVADPQSSRMFERGKERGERIAQQQIAAMQSRLQRWGMASEPSTAAPIRTYTEPSPQQGGTAPQPEGQAATGGSSDPLVLQPGSDLRDALAGNANERHASLIAAADRAGIDLGDPDARAQFVKGYQKAPERYAEREAERWTERVRSEAFGGKSELQVYRGQARNLKRKLKSAGALEDIEKAMPIIAEWEAFTERQTAERLAAAEAKLRDKGRDTVDPVTGAVMGAGAAVGDAVRATGRAIAGLFKFEDEIDPAMLELLKQYQERKNGQ